MIFYSPYFLLTLPLIIFCSELAEMKAQYAQEISAAHMQISDFQKTVEETLRRAEEVNVCFMLFIVLFRLAKNFLLLLVLFLAQKQLFNEFLFFLFES